MIFELNSYIKSIVYIEQKVLVKVAGFDDLEFGEVTTNLPFFVPLSAGKFEDQSYVTVCEPAEPNTREPLTDPPSLLTQL